ncbi:Coenzyme F420-dependent N5 N10-methylene tetrahydromethanopterin reductase-like protein [Kribbella flavida DSM 17836]|uniref:Coenzyme F420-dependent N5 N10-methylene tetrahydromethanopterin reductase-like protein n=1 Tax=Kribbella flavida (strain DSM 17836 / JCM 10339 / NBRC 14399) TaxID=479435 RepID=D2PM05_KRIFD|nr:LLM class flavin-dependent oxidoreductase [Kribbella flavida]ADB32585.1 Coenzyme F420-dependent N5 N10-methylene tetrahydromethanopterin reductase-like protein [Kribbella flavida DSM 17836]
MEIGVNVPNFGPGATPERLLAWARTVEGLGYDLLMMSDHVVITPDVAEQYPAPFYEPFTTLSWLAGSTSTIRLGTTVVIAPYRHPLLVARMAANLHQLSGRRFVLGVGVGWAAQEFAALGAEFRHRGRLTDELLDTVTTAWQDTDDYRADGLPIWVGGGMDAGPRRAVRYGAAWHPLRQTMPWLRDAAKCLRQVAEQQGRPVPGFAPRILLHLTDRPRPDTDRRAGEGSIDQILADLDELRLLGAHTVVLDPFVGDPAETEHPEVAWQALSTVKAQLSSAETEKL